MNLEIHIGFLYITVQMQTLSMCFALLGMRARALSSADTIYPYFTHVWNACECRDKSSAYARIIFPTRFAATRLTVMRDTHNKNKSHLLSTSEASILSSYFIDLPHKGWLGKRHYLLFKDDEIKVQTN